MLALIICIINRVNLHTCGSARPAAAAAGWRVSSVVWTPGSSVVGGRRWAAASVRRVPGRCQQPEAASRPVGGAWPDGPQRGRRWAATSSSARPGMVSAAGSSVAVGRRRLTRRPSTDRHGRQHQRRRDWPAVSSGVEFGVSLIGLDGKASSGVSSGVDWIGWQGAGAVGIGDVFDRVRVGSGRRDGEGEIEAWSARRDSGQHRRRTKGLQVGRRTKKISLSLLSRDRDRDVLDNSKHLLLINN